MSEFDISSMTAAVPGESPGIPVEQPSFGFHEVLSAANPLQYLPVVGSIYRAATGDTIAEPLRVAGSMLVSGLTGGPVGLLLGAAGAGVQKLLGIDMDQVAQHTMLAMGMLSPPAGVAPVLDAADRRAAAAAYAQAAGLGSIAG